MLRARGLCAGLAAAGLFVTADTDRITAASEQSRTIAFKHIHTNETLSIVYKKDGKYVPEALEKINWIMRDWRKNQVQKMDPQTIDLLWEMHTELGSHEPINIICGYRSHETNEMLRRTVGGQASQSQHITGKAIDATFPDVPLKQHALLGPRPRARRRRLLSDLRDSIRARRHGERSPLAAAAAL